LGSARRFGFREGVARHGGGFDQRQRAVVKVHYFGHGGGGAAALKAHARYIARDAAARDVADQVERPSAKDRMAERGARDHAAYLGRAERGVFYDALSDGVDGGARMAVWAREDRRHFRIILAPEKGAELGELKPYVRDVMERAEKALGTRLEWVAVDHHDTDNPHTHIVLRGRRGDGRVLVIPRDFVQHGFRNAARDAATDRLGVRTRADERLALAREVRAHRPTRLDALIARHVDKNGAVRIAALQAPGGDAALTSAMKARARELQRLGLAAETKRNVLTFKTGWRARLSEMELHLDIRKRLVRERTQRQRTPERGGVPGGLLRGPDR
jgi:type IV secretory pathway VirD2 relaxase